MPTTATTDAPVEPVDARRGRVGRFRLSVWSAALLNTL